ncbi:Cyclin-dependent kinase inhibitor 3 [Morella rubra]|uniref:Cyclin-dependent kinase inhibitor 3 n=1 Tax=Morella rubra TaxID=262757 RepID=A0A6A1UJD3_9ROSI|nr:Cyclin-dependent kinase inhibitor 3 [Morella rubra]
MGKYMKKSKITGDVALLMEVSHSPQAASIGVCTRAKALALQRHQKTIPSPAVVPDPDSSSLSYLQLRSRRLQKPPLLRRQQQPRECCRESPSPRPNGRNSGPKTVSVDSGSLKEKEDGKEQECLGIFWKEDEAEEGNDLGVEVSFGENNVELDGRDRSTRESTPCSLIRDSDSLRTPSSTTRRTTSENNQRVRNDLRRNIPTTQEMEEFFVCAERQQQRIFIEKYNFDVVNDLPLQGRYEWVRIGP